MFALILALSLNPVTQQVNWKVTADNFSSYESCEAFAQSHAGQEYMKTLGAVGYVCDTVK